MSLHWVINHNFTYPFNISEPVPFQSSKNKIQFGGEITKPNPRIKGEQSITIDINIVVFEPQYYFFVKHTKNFLFTFPSEYVFPTDYNLSQYQADVFPAFYFTLKHTVQLYNNRREQFSHAASVIIEDITEDTAKIIVKSLFPVPDNPSIN